MDEIEKAEDTNNAQDHIDVRQEQWAQHAPHVDTRGMAIFGRMRQISLKVRPKIESMFSEHGIDSGEADVIFTLYRSGPPHMLRPTELYRWLMLSSGGMTHRLNRLEKSGLIERIADPHDKRSALVALTEKGRVLALEIFAQDMAYEKQALSALSTEEQQCLSALLRKLLLSL